MTRFFQTISLLGAWGAIAMVSHFLTSPVPEISQTLPNETSSPKSTSLPFREGTDSLQGILSASSSSERWDRMEHALKALPPAKLKQWYLQAEHLADYQMKETIQESILSAWVREDPDAVWKHFNESYIPVYSLMSSWLHAGDPDDLIARIESLGEDSYRADWVLGPLFYEFARHYPDQISKLETLGKRDPRSLTHNQIRAAALRGDREALIQFAEAHPNENYNLFEHLFLNDENRENREDLALAWLDRIPDSAKDHYFHDLVESWPEDKDPTPLIDLAFGDEEVSDRFSIVKEFMRRNLPDEHISGLAKRVLRGEGEFSQRNKDEMLHKLIRYHPEIATHMLPEVDPFRAGRLIDDMGTYWDRSDLEGAIEWSQTLSGFNREGFIQKLLSSSEIKDRESLYTWMRNQSPDYLERVGAVEQLKKGVVTDGIGAVQTAGHISENHRRLVFQHALERYRYRSKPKLATALKEAFPEFQEEATEQP